MCIVLINTISDVGLTVLLGSADCLHAVTAWTRVCGGQNVALLASQYKPLAYRTIVVVR